MKQDNRDIASELINSTIKVIARDGFDKASTRNIAGECGVADAYIYISFKDKDDLFAKAFRKKDMELFTKIDDCLDATRQGRMKIKDKFFVMLGLAWNFLVKSPENCRFYIQYYYSPYYKKYSAQEHSDLWQPILDKMSGMFKSGTDVKATLRLTLNTLLGLAIKASSDSAAMDESMLKTNSEMVWGLLEPVLKEEDFE